jgi:hypothetical protein
VISRQHLTFRVTTTRVVNAPVAVDADVGAAVVAEVKIKVDRTVRQSRRSSLATQHG